MNKDWDYETDVVIVGSGAAGYSTAITANYNGSQVIMLEKAPDAGGTTARSGGAHWIPRNHLMLQEGLKDPRGDAIHYMVRYSYPHIYNPMDPQLGLPDNEYNLITTYYDTASQAINFLTKVRALDSVLGLGLSGNPTPDYQENIPENRGSRGRTLFPKTPDGERGLGLELVRQLKYWADKHKIPIFFNHRVTEVIQDSNEVEGVEAVCGNQKFTFHARKAVVFASGGYTHNSEFMQNFQYAPTFGGCAVPTNEGDFLRIGQKIGTKLGNMSKAFLCQVVLDSAVGKEFPTTLFYALGDSMIEVNRYGKRVMDEKRNYHDRTRLHFNYDVEHGCWENMLLFLIYDQRTVDYWPGFYPIPAPGEDNSHVIKGKTWEELTEGIEAHLEKFTSYTGGFKISSDFLENLKNTVSRYNEFSRFGVDRDFHRGDYSYDNEVPVMQPFIEDVRWPSEDQETPTMYPISDEGPYYAVVLAAGTLDTNGGPVINPKAQVLNLEGKPIPRLYGAGNCIASACGSAYWGAGATIGNALTFGYIAGLNAAKEPVKEVVMLTAGNK